MTTVLDNKLIHGGREKNSQGLTVDEEAERITREIEAFNPTRDELIRYVGLLEAHFLKTNSLVVQTVGVAESLAGRWQAIKNGHKQRDDYYDRLDFIGIVQKIHKSHETIQSIINAPDLERYRKKYPGHNTLRGWVKAAIPDRPFGPGAKKRGEIS